MAQEAFIEKEIAFSGRFSGNVFQTIALSFSAYKWRVILLFVTGFFARFSLLISTNILGYWADSLCKAPATCKPVPSLFAGLDSDGYVIVLICAAVIGFALNTAFRVGISRTGAHAASLMYDEVTLRTSRLPMSFFDTTPVGRIVSRFSSDYAAIFRMAGGPLGEFMCIVFDLVLILVLTSFASAFFVPLVISVAVLNYLSYRAQNPMLRIERRNLARDRGPAIAHFSETVQGVSPIRVFGRKASFATRFSSLLETYLTQRVKTAFAVQKFSLTMTTITAGVLLVTGVSGVWLCRNGYVSAGSLGVAFTFIMMTSSTVQQFFEWLAALEEALTGVERMDDYLRRPLEKGAQLPAETIFDLGQRVEQAKDAAPSLKSAGVSVSNLSLRYRADLPLVLKNIDFEMRPGEQLAVVGRTGSGKSSLIQALFCLYPIETGSISISGYTPDLSQQNGNAGVSSSLSLHAFRSLMALIPQDPSLFRGTLRANLTSDPTLPDAFLRETLEKIGVFSFVSRLSSPTGNPLDSIIEEKGSNLSLGERQLLCMGRALLQNTPVIIMDEATSSIDPHSEELLVTATKTHMRDKTRIIVAHRLSTVETADRVLWLDGGVMRMLDTPAIVLPEFHRAE